MDKASRFVAARSICTTLMKMLHGGDQLPFGPHSDGIWAVGIDNLESQRRGKLEILKSDADGRGALADHADVGCRGEDVEEARASALIFTEAQWQRIVVQLRNRGLSQTSVHMKGSEKISP
jgi:hypothetical protein